MTPEVAELVDLVEQLVLRLRERARHDKKLGSDVELAEVAAVAYHLARRIKRGGAASTPAPEPNPAPGDNVDTAALRPVQWTATDDVEGEGDAAEEPAAS